MDTAVAPYADARTFYFSPLKVFEYLAAGRAVVASAVGQLKSVIRHGVNGLLCPPGDPEALAAVLQQLQREPGLRARLAIGARASVVPRHTWDRQSARVLQVADAARMGQPRARART